jgi:small subunit ribosomal protein S6
MAKYEIILVVDGTLEENNAKVSIQELESLINTSPNFKITELGLKTMAFAINKKNKGWYLQYNFENTDPNIIKEFRRLALINKNVLRHLIINLEKEYGYRSTQNQKKINRSKIQLEKYNERVTRLRAEREAREKAQAELSEMITPAVVQNKKEKENE